MNIYTREFFNDRKGVSIWLAWNDDGEYDLGRTEEEARERLIEPIDWRFVALTIMSNRLNDLPPNYYKQFGEIIIRLRNGEEKLINRKMRTS